MIKKLRNIFKSQVVKDSYFGEMSSSFDDYNNCYYLDKDIEVVGVIDSVILYIQTTNQKSNKEQQKAYRFIKDNFKSIKKEVINYLTSNKFIVFEKEYRLESITIPEYLDKNLIKWEIDFANLKDGFIRIVVEMENLKPISFSVEG